MNERPTPETDAEVNELVTSNTYNMVTASFARRLERERDEARDAAEKAKAFKRVMKEDNANLRRELATERALADRLAKSLHKLAKCCPTVKCEHLHHPPKDRHSYDSQCLVEQRYQESVNHGLQNYGVWKEARK